MQFYLFKDKMIKFKPNHNFLIIYMIKIKSCYLSIWFNSIEFENKYLNTDECVVRHFTLD